MRVRIAAVRGDLTLKGFEQAAHDVWADLQESGRPTVEKGYGTLMAADPAHARRLFEELAEEAVAI